MVTTVEFKTMNLETVRETTTVEGDKYDQVERRLLTREQAFRTMTELTHQGYRLVEERTGRYYKYIKPDE